MRRRDPERSIGEATGRERVQALSPFWYVGTSVKMRTHVYNKDSLLPWGKHANSKLVIVPIDYLQHFIGKWDSGPPEDKISWANWHKAFSDEVDRRRGIISPAQLSGLTIEEEAEKEEFLDAIGEMDLDEGEAILPSNTKTSVTGKTNPKSNVRISLKKITANDASLLLLKEFIMRTDKNLGIVDWTLQQAREALRYGEIKMEKSGKTIVAYLGQAFHYDTSDPKVMTLTRIWGEKDC